MKDEFLIRRDDQRSSHTWAFVSIVPCICLLNLSLDSIILDFINPILFNSSKVGTRFEVKPTIWGPTAPGLSDSTFPRNLLAHFLG